jgi:hypothetical protein
MSGNDRLLPVLHDTQTADMQHFQRFPAGSWPGFVLPDAASCCVRSGPDRPLVLSGRLRAWAGTARGRRG